MTTITAKQAHELLQKGDAILIDVRDADEFKEEHIPYALSLPLSTLDESFAKLAIPQGKTVIMHCLKGMRGQKACESICNSEQSAHEPLNIEGGIAAWKQSGLPVIGNAPKMAIFRQIQIIVGFALICLIGAGLAGVMIAFYAALILSILFFTAGVTGYCGLAYILNQLPWNKKG
jgi:rhodanese-related sulfurtransferase